MEIVWHRYLVPAAARALIETHTPLREGFDVDPKSDGTVSIEGFDDADLDLDFDRALIAEGLAFDHFHTDPDTGDYDGSTMRCYRPGSADIPGFNVTVDVTRGGKPYVTLDDLDRASAQGALPERPRVSEIRAHLGLPAHSVADWVAAHSHSPV